MKFKHILLGTLLSAFLMSCGSNVKDYALKRWDKLTDGEIKPKIEYTSDSIVVLSGEKDGMYTCYGVLITPKDTSETIGDINLINAAQATYNVLKENGSVNEASVKDRERAFGTSLSLTIIFGQLKHIMNGQELE